MLFFGVAMFFLKYNYTPSDRAIEYLKKSISFRGPKIWNSLSEQARNSESLSIFNVNISS